MKKLGLVLLSCFMLNALTAQQRAVTETGDEVILYDDGTWTYQDESTVEAVEIPTNPKAFKKDKSSSFLLKSTKLDNGFWLNPKKWSFTKSVTNPEAEYELHLKDGDLYGMVITERIEMPLETLMNVALENGRSVAPDLRIVNKEYRTVNGIKVLHLQMDGTTQGIEFSYYGYYLSSSNGTLQFITYTAQNLLDDYRKDCELLLNGLVELE